MQEINIKSFIHLNDAVEFLEMELFDALTWTEEIDAEVKYINGQFRVGVTKNGRQKEFKFDQFD